MISMIKDICIFMVIAQAVLLLIPGKTYTKYVRILVGIILILKITQPVFDLLLDEEQEAEMRNKLYMLEEQLEIPEADMEIGDESMSIYEGIEEELQSRLEGCSAQYEVTGVELAGEEDGRQGTAASQGGIEKIVLAVAPKKAESEEGKIWVEPIKITPEKGEGDDKEQELKELFGSRLGVDSNRIEIRYE